VGLSRGHGGAGAIGKRFRVSQHRGEFVESALAPYLIATVHPSAILRAPDEKDRHEQERMFVDNMKNIAKRISKAIWFDGVP
jgi:uracil-DNA glycosylase